MNPENHSNPQVSVVIVNFNGGPLLRETVVATLASDVPVEVLVVDNASTDGSLGLLVDLEENQGCLHIIRNGQNLGFAYASNIGIEHSTGAFILCLNPDCVIRPDTLSRMLARMQNHPEAGMAGCLIRNPDGSEQVGCRRSMPTPWLSIIRILHLNRIFRNDPRFQSFILANEPLPDRPVFMEAISGAFMLVRREGLEQVGYLDDKYFLHCEDLDWCMRFRMQGWKILFVPDIEVVHYKGRCSWNRPVRVLWHKHRGMVRFYNKFFRRQYPLPLMTVVVSAVWVRFTLLVAATWLGSLGGRQREAAVAPAVGRLCADTRSTGAGFSPAEYVNTPVRPAAPPATPHAALDGLYTAAAADADIRSNLQGQRILVTGATGFIGRWVVATLLDMGVPVTALVRNTTPVARLWGDTAVATRKADLTRPETLAGTCDGIDTIIHLAGYAHAESGIEDRDSEMHWKVTVEGTRSLLAEAQAAGVQRIVFISSIKAMGEGSEQCLDEASPAQPESPYGRAKLSAEGLILEVGQQHDIHTSILRLPMVYGHDNKGNLPRMVAAIDRGWFPPLPEVGNRRSMVHVDDVVQAILLVMARPESRNQTYIVTDGRDYSTHRIYTPICEALGRRVPGWTVPVELLNLGARLGDVAGRIGRWPMPFNSDVLRKLNGSAWYSSDKIRRELGYHPHHTLETALPEIVAEYRKCRLH